MSLNEDATPAPGNTVAQAGHRLARLRPRYRWWRMLLTGLVGIALYIAILLIVIVPLAIVSMLVPGWGIDAQVLLTRPAGGRVLELLLHPAALFIVGDVHVFEANLAAIVRAQDLHDLADGRPLQAERTADAESNADLCADAEPNRDAIAHAGADSGSEVRPSPRSVSEGGDVVELGGD